MRMRRPVRHCCDAAMPAAPLVPKFYSGFARILFAAPEGMGQDPFFGWLATQPAFIEVGLGILFCLLIAPVLLAMIAVGLTALEAKLGRILSHSGLLLEDATPIRSGSRWEPLRRAVAQELPWLRKALSKRHA